jgi:4-diphosphocytidyl-2-C-methyl-D-erythritol kinase
MILYPNAKINIGLNILFKRADGFHELETIMYPIPLTDILTINISANSTQKINFTTTGIKIDGNKEDNLICKAYNLLDSKYPLPALDIHLHKSIPFGAGLGGGSADCAFAIKGINELGQLNLPMQTLEEIAAELGSDCPFFIQNKPAIAKGRGELLESFNMDLSAYNFVVIIPPIPISTKEAYSLVKPSTPVYNLKDSIQSGIRTWKDEIQNNFEDSVFPQFPEIQNIKETLYEKGALYASLSGSGSAVFGIFREIPNFETVFPKEYFIWFK